jgi:hypothetical protein
MASALPPKTSEGQHSSDSRYVDSVRVSEHPLSKLCSSATPAELVCRCKGTLKQLRLGNGGSRFFRNVGTCPRNHMALYLTKPPFQSIKLTAVTVCLIVLSAPETRREGRFEVFTAMTMKNAVF